MSALELPSGEQKKRLEDFVTSNSDLEQLEALLAGFNIFDAIGMKYQEIRHSRTLAFLLNPQNDHGLGQHFLKRVLKEIALEQQNMISVVDIDVANFSDAEARCEWNSIDILIICPVAKVIVAIENKLRANEHGDQLTRYKKTIDEHPDWAGYQRIYAFLTVDGHEPVRSADNDHWCSISYKVIFDELQRSHTNLKSKLGADQDVLIRHYLDLLGRSILEDSDVAELARKIYAAHKEALDIIFEHMPDLRLEIRNYLLEKIAAQPTISVGSYSGRFLRFVHKDWSFNPDIQSSSKPFRRQYVAFEFNIDAVANSIQLEAVIGTVPELQRHELFEKITTQLQSPIKKSNKAHPRGWKYTKLNFEDAPDTDAIFKKIDNWWASFIDNHLERVSSAVHLALDSTKPDLNQDPD